MLAGTLHTWIKRHIAVRQRLERMCTSYLLFLTDLPPCFEQTTPCNSLGSLMV